VIALVARSFGRIRYLMAAMTIVLAGFQISIIGAASTFVGSGDFERLSQLTPAFLAQAMGPALTSFAGMVMFAYFDVLIVMLVVQSAIYLATEPAGEVETGLVDLLLARPLARHTIVTRSLIVMMAGTVALTAAMNLTTWVGLWWLAPPGVAWPRPSTVLNLATHLNLTAWCFGSIALAVSSWARRRGAALTAVAVGAVAAYLVDLLALLWSPARELGRLSPFHYFRGSAILSGTSDPWRDLSVLGALTLAATAIAYLGYQRRDM
jgi:ABC-2 type transport system permease protein